MTTPTIGIACHSFRTDGGMGRYVQLLSEGLLNRLLPAAIKGS